MNDRKQNLDEPGEEKISEKAYYDDSLTFAEEGIRYLHQSIYVVSDLGTE